MNLTKEQAEELNRRYEVARGGTGTLSFDRMYEVRHTYFEELRGDAPVAAPDEPVISTTTIGEIDG